MTLARLALSESPKCHYLFFFPRDLRPRSYQSVATFASPPVLRLRNYQRIAIYRFPHPTWALEISKLSILSCSPPHTSRSAPSKLLKCNYLLFLVSLGIGFFHPTCAFEVTKVSLPLCSPLVLRPRSFHMFLHRLSMKRRWGQGGNLETPHENYAKFF